MTTSVTAWHARWSSSKTCGPATVEPRVPNQQSGADHRRGDIKVHKGGTTWILDVGVVCPGTQRYFDKDSDRVLGRAAETYASVKSTKYADQPNFVPFIVETGGRVNSKARDFLDTLRLDPTPFEQADGRGGIAVRIPAGSAGPGGARRGPFRGASPQDIVLRGMMQALVRMQAYMLADIVVAIPRVDLAMEAVE